MKENKIVKGIKNNGIQILFWFLVGLMCIHFVSCSGKTSQELPQGNNQTKEHFENNPYSMIIEYENNKFQHVVFHPEKMTLRDETITLPLITIYLSDGTVFVDTLYSAKSFTDKQLSEMPIVYNIGLPEDTGIFVTDILIKIPFDLGQEYLNTISFVNK